MVRLLSQTVLKNRNGVKLEGIHSPSPSCLPACSELVCAEEWMAFLVSLPPSVRALSPSLPSLHPPTYHPFIHRPADATLMQWEARAPI